MKSRTSSACSVPTTQPLLVGHKRPWPHRKRIRQRCCTSKIVTMGLVPTLLLVVGVRWMWLTYDMVATGNPQHTIDTFYYDEASTALANHMDLLVETQPQQAQPPQPQCLDWQGSMTPSEIQEQVLSQPPPTGLVVTLVLGDAALEFLCRFFPSQLQHLILPQQNWDVLLVLGTMPPKDPNGKNHYTMREDPQAQKRKQALISCLNLVPILPQQHGTTTTINNNNRNHAQQTWQNLDGSTMITEEYRVGLLSSNTTTTHGNHTVIHDVRIFLAETQLQLPRYLQSNPSLQKIPMTPRQCQAPLAYVMGTKWYVDEMLHLSILQQYDWFIKLDTDVVFRAPLNVMLLHDLTIRRAVWGHTGEYPDTVDPPCGTGITKAVHNFLNHGGSPRSRSDTATPTSIKTADPTPFCSGDHPRFSKDADLYYSNFILGKVEFFQSPQVLALSQFLAEYPEGFFRYRWTDQIFWHFALGLVWNNVFSDQHSSHGWNANNTTGGGIVVDYSEFRCAPHPKCWMSVHYYNHDRCDNGGVFFHTKAKTSSAVNSKWSWKEYLEEDKLASIQEKPLDRHISPYSVQYRDECHTMTH